MRFLATPIRVYNPPHREDQKSPVRNFVERRAPLALLLGFLGSWELLSRAGILHALLFPAPSAIAIEFVRLFSLPTFGRHAWITIYETIVGFAIGGGLGIISGVLLALNQMVYRMFLPYVVVFQIIPKVTLAPIFLTWFGFGTLSKIVMAASISFFPALINTMVGLWNTDEDSLLLFRSFEANTRQTFFKLLLPNALPSILAGLKASLTLALIGAIVGEFVGAQEGIGRLIQTYNFRFEIARVYALILFLSLVGYLMYIALDALERKFTFWHERSHLQ